MTGADTITVEKIIITFVEVSGVKRQPIFRTCGPTLELPNTYNCYNELAEEFSHILRGNVSFDFV